MKKPTKIRHGCGAASLNCCCCCSKQGLAWGAGACADTRGIRAPVDTCQIQKRKKSKQRTKTTKTRIRCCPYPLRKPYTEVQREATHAHEQDTAATTTLSRLKPDHTIGVHLVSAHEPVLRPGVAIKHDGLGELRRSALGDHQFGVAHPSPVLPHLSKYREEEEEGEKEEEKQRMYIYRESSCNC